MVVNPSINTTSEFVILTKEWFALNSSGDYAVVEKNKLIKDFEILEYQIILND